MAAAEKPSNENERLANLRSYQILDTPPSPRFDQLVELAAEICQIPMSLVTLIDAERQGFKARVGIDVNETPRELAFCAHAILDSEPRIIPDATQDARFEDNAFVLNDPQVRFYAGISLQSPQGYALGTLCVVDMQPRELTPFQLSVLKRLAAQAMDMLELHRLMFVNHEQRARYELALESAEVGLWELPEREGETGWCTPQLYRLLGYGDGEVDFGPEALHQRLHPDDARAAHKDIRLISELNFGEAVIALNQRKLYRALENLLQNALKFTHAGGEIRLSVGQTEHEAWLRLEDTGIGIPAELMPALFEKFGPARRPGLAGERSHGLGLYITQEIITQHGGRIEVSSEPGQGTRFEITLPLLHQLSPNPVSA